MTDLGYAEKLLGESQILPHIMYPNLVEERSVPHIFRGPYISPIIRTRSYPPVMHPTSLNCTMSVLSFRSARLKLSCRPLLICFGDSFCHEHPQIGLGKKTPFPGRCGRVWIDLRSKLRLEWCRGLAWHCIA